MECESECDEDEVQSQEAREDARRKQVEAVRKKLGLPELELDALPSSIASKMLTLGPTCFHSGCFWLQLESPRTGVAKWVANMEKILSAFNAATQLSDLQKQSLV